jgi:hypothetical protein
MSSSSRTGRLAGLADDLAFSEQANLYLFLSIMVLALLARITGLSELFTVALLSTVTLPVTYALSYYYERGPREFTFVKRRGGGPARPTAGLGRFGRSLAAVISGYATGFVVFAALSGSLDLLTYTLAYAVAMLMRAVIAHSLPFVAKFVDVESPAALMLVSLFTALLAYMVIAAFAYLL